MRRLMTEELRSLEAGVERLSVDVLPELLGFVLKRILTAKELAPEDVRHMLKLAESRVGKSLPFGIPASRRRAKNPFLEES